MCSAAAPAARRSGTRCSTRLSGRRVAPGPAGSPYRGRSDVLPTGRNLFAVDPRAVPTRVRACAGHQARGRIAAPASAGSRRLAEGARRRSLGLGDHAHRGRGIFHGAAACRRRAALGCRVRPRDRLRDHSARAARPAAHRRDAARLRPVPRRVHAARAIVRGRLRSAVAARFRGRRKSLSRARCARVRPASRTVRRRHCADARRLHAGASREAAGEAWLASSSWAFASDGEMQAGPRRHRGAARGGRQLSCMCRTCRRPTCCSPSDYAAHEAGVAAAAASLGAHDQVALSSRRDAAGGAACANADRKKFRASCARAPPIRHGSRA